MKTTLTITPIGGGELIEIEIPHNDQIETGAYYLEGHTASIQVSHSFDLADLETALAGYSLLLHGPEHDYYVSSNLTDILNSLTSYAVHKVSACKLVRQIMIDAGYDCGMRQGRDLVEDLIKRTTKC